MKGLRSLLAAPLSAAGLLLFLASCGGSTSQPPTGGTPFAPATLSITTASLAGGTVGQSYSATLQASGGTGTRTWSVITGSLPDGLTLAAATGTVSGTPTAAGTFNFTVQVQDSSSPPQTANQALSIAIASGAQPLSITTTSLPNGQEGVSYSATLQATGGTGARTWSVIVGALPDGLTLDSATGTISGTPTAAGTFNFTVQVQDSASPPQTASQALSITIMQAFAITTASLPNGRVGMAYSVFLTTSGGMQPFTWSLAAGNLPPGLSLSTAVGEISGTPTTAGTFNFTVQVSDDSTPTQTATRNLSLTIDAPSTLLITTTSLPDGAVNTDYSVVLQATGGTPPLTWSVTTGSLPPGLTLGASDGTISGTPSTAGTFPFTVQVVDAVSDTDTASLSLTVIASSPGRNETIATATPLSNGTFRASISPYVDPPNASANPDRDVYEIRADGGNVVTVEICARRQSALCTLTQQSPLDSVIEIVNGSGTRFTSCRNEGTDDGVMGNADPTPTAFDDTCLNDDIELGVIQDSKLEFQVPGTGEQIFYVRVLDFRGDARPDMVYEIRISGAN